MKDLKSKIAALVKAGHKPKSAIAAVLAHARKYKRDNDEGVPKRGNYALDEETPHSPNDFMELGDQPPVDNPDVQDEQRSLADRLLEESDREYYAEGGKVGGASGTGGAGGAETSTTGNKTKTGGSNPGGASTGGAGTVTVTARDLGAKGIQISNIGGKTDAENPGGMDPDDKNHNMMAYGGLVEDQDGDVTPEVQYNGNESDYNSDKVATAGHKQIDPNVPQFKPSPLSEEARKALEYKKKSRKFGNRRPAG